VERRFCGLFMTLSVAILYIVERLMNEKLERIRKEAAIFLGRIEKMKILNQGSHVPAEIGIERLQNTGPEL
jgi:hypothetical protein